jgi:cytochrome c peroxidase
VLRVFLIDREKRIRNVYSSSFLHADSVWSDVRTILAEKSPPVTAVSLAAREAKPRVPTAAPLGLPDVPIPEGASMTPARVALGRKLFFDRRLSQNGTISCALCHVPSQGFTRNDMATAVGIEGRTVRRNAPTLYNAAYAKRLFHDGRESTLERQVWSPLLAADEMGNSSSDAVLERLASSPDYDGLFEAAFDGRGPSMETVGAALASYERTLVSANSPFDRWRFAGEEAALSPAALRGFALFTGKAGCVACHSIGEKEALFMDQDMHDTGIGYRQATASPARAVAVDIAPGVRLTIDPQVIEAASEPRKADFGLLEISGRPGPFMHDGSIETLREVIEFYDRGGVAHDRLDERIRPLRLRPAEKEDLVAFLESLTGDDVDEIVAEAEAEPVGSPE